MNEAWIPRVAIQLNCCSICEHWKADPHVAPDTDWACGAVYRCCRKAGHSPDDMSAEDRLIEHSYALQREQS